MTKLNQNLLDDDSIVQGNEYSFQINIPNITPSNITEAIWVVVSEHGGTPLLNLNLTGGKITKAADGGSGTDLTINLDDTDTDQLVPGEYLHECGVVVNGDEKEAARGRLTVLDSSIT